MATDGFVLMLWMPMLIIALGLTISYFYINKDNAAPKEFVHFGGRRILLGLSGAMFATIIYSIITAAMIGLNKVEQGHIDYTDLIKAFIGYCLYIFALTGPVIMLGVSLIGLPIMVGLRRIRLASHLGAIIVSTICGACSAIYVLTFPYNNWCTSNPIECAASNFSSSFIVCAAVGIGFSFGARLPLLRNGNVNET